MGATKHLIEALDMKISEIFQVDLAFGLAAGIAAGIVAVRSPATLLSMAATTTEILGVILGAVVGGVSILAAFFDQSFLRKLRAINRDPVRYLAPFLFTATLGVIAMLFLLVLSGLGVATTPWVLVVLGSFAGLLSVWSLVSLLPLLGTLVQFIRLKVDALDVPDDVDLPRPGASQPAVPSPANAQPPVAPRRRGAV